MTLPWPVWPLIALGIVCCGRLPAASQPAGVHEAQSPSQRYQEVEAALVMFEKETISARETFELLWPELFVGPDACVGSDVEPETGLKLTWSTEHWRTALMLCRPDEKHPVYVGFVARHHDGWWAWEQTVFPTCGEPSAFVPSPVYEPSTGELRVYRPLESGGGCGAIASLYWDGRGRWARSWCRAWEDCSNPRFSAQWPVTELGLGSDITAFLSIAVLVAPAEFELGNGQTLAPAISAERVSNEMEPGERYVYRSIGGELPEEIHLVFLSPDHESVTVAGWVAVDSARTSPMSFEIAWTELANGASFQEGRTEVSSASCQTEVGPLPGTRYTLARSETGTISICYADAYPALPVRYEVIRKGRPELQLVLSGHGLVSGDALDELEASLEEEPTPSAP